MHITRLANIVLCPRRGEHTSTEKYTRAKHTCQNTRAKTARASACISRALPTLFCALNAESTRARKITPAQNTHAKHQARYARQRTRCARDDSCRVHTHLAHSSRASGGAAHRGRAAAGERYPRPKDRGKRVRVAPRACGAAGAAVAAGRTVLGLERVRAGKSTEQDGPRCLAHKEHAANQTHARGLG